MARKQFVSSKKNAPSRVVSSKEAALHGRNPGAADNEDEDSEDASLNGGESPDSPMSSAPSSPLSSDGEGEIHDAEDDADDTNDVADPADEDDDGAEGGTAVAEVQVVPATVGRGKQLRFPTAISRGKEARILHNGSDRGDNSDSESYASVASDEEEDLGSGADDDMSQSAPPSQPTATASLHTPSPTKVAVDSAVVSTQDEDVSYPIKAFRARKRHRPDSGYITQMSVYVRDCLLSVRDVENAEVLRDDTHDEFRRKLSAGTVERVQWKEVSPSPPAATPMVSEKPVPKSSPRETSDKSDKPLKEPRTDRTVSSTSSSKSSSRKSGADRSDPKDEKSSLRLDTEAGSSRKRERSGKEKDKETRGSSREDTEKREASSKSVKQPSMSTSSSTKTAADANANGKSKSLTEEVRQKEGVLCVKCQKSVSEQNADDEASKRAVAAAAAAPATVPIVEPVPTGSFTLPTQTGRDITQMREESVRLNEQARALKHEGNRRGESDPGLAGQVDQGRYFLKSSAKFFQHALLLADIKAAYREIGDERHARSYGDMCMQTLAQTYTLIEITIRKLHGAGHRRLVAVGYKLASIVKLTIYRLQHVKLFSLHSDLFTPGRSPDTRQNGTTPPISGSSSDSQEAAVRSLLLREMEHTLRGFEMWQRYEACRVEVLPRITNPAVMDMGVLFEDLNTELSRS